MNMKYKKHSIVVHFFNKNEPSNNANWQGKERWVAVTENSGEIFGKSKHEVVGEAKNYINDLELMNDKPLDYESEILDMGGQNE